MRSVTWVVGTGNPTVIAIGDNDTPTQVRTAIQGALDAAAAAAQAQDLPATVTLSAGEFIINGTGTASAGGVHIDSDVTFQGTVSGGVKQSTITLDDAFTSADVTGIVRTVSQADVHDVTIRDLVIKGNGAASSNDVDGIYAGYLPSAGDPPAPHVNITIDNVDVSQCSRYGIDPHEQLSNLTIRNSASHDNDVDGFTLDFIEGGTIENNVAYNNGRHGFNVVTGTSDVALRNNTAHDNGGNGLVIQPPSQSDGRGLYSSNISVIGGEYFANDEVGIKINSAKDVIVEGAYVHDNLLYGIRIGVSSWNPLLQPFPPPSSERIAITGNRIENNGGAGGNDAEIDLKSEHNVTITATIEGNRIGTNGSPAQFDIKASTFVTVTVEGNMYGDGTPSISGLTILDDPATIGAVGLVTLSSASDSIVTDVGRQYVDALAGSDTISTGAETDSLIGGEGNDNLDAGSGNDVLAGGEGNDTLTGGTGADWMAGGSQNDVYSVENADDIVFELLNKGYDTVNTTLTSYTLGANLDRLNSNGSADFVGTGNGLANRFQSLGGDDRFVDALGGADIFSGGAGTDTVDFRTSASGAALNFTTSVHGGAAAGDSYSSIEKFLGSNTAADTMTGGGTGRWVFVGGGGDDTLTGGVKNDQLIGQGGNDTLIGGADRDSLDGGTGNDTMTGGTQDDVFVFIDAAFGQDIIADYVDGGDSFKVFSAVADDVSDFTIANNGTTSVTLTLAANPANTITVNGSSAITITNADFVFY
jgi:parallel beta-helix repeat protein